MSDASSTRWVDAVSKWHEEGGNGRVLRGTPAYDEVAAIYQEWHPEWYPSEAPSRRPRLKKAQRVAHHVAQLEKIGVRTVEPDEAKAMPVPTRLARALRPRPGVTTIVASKGEPEVIGQIGSPPGLPAENQEVVVLPAEEEALAFITGKGLNREQLARIISRLPY